MESGGRRRPADHVGEGEADMSRVRSILAAILGVIAVIGVFASVTAIWTRDVLSDSDEIAGAVNDALEDPVVVNGLAVFLTDQVFTALDIENATEQLVPAPLGPLAPAIVGGAHSVVVNQFERLLSTDAARNTITATVERSHQALIKLLQGDGLVDGISVSEGQVTVNFLPLIGRGFGAIQNLGLLTNVEFPQLDPAGDPQQQIADLEDTFGRDLPDDFGQLTVYQSDRLANAEQIVARAQEVVVVARRALAAVLVVTVACIAGCILLARRRRRATLILALAVAGVMVLARILVNRLIERLPELAVNPAARAAVSDVLDSLTDGLRALISLTIIVGLIIALIAYLRGDSASAGSIKSAAGAGGGSVVTAASAHRDATALIAFGAALGILLLFGLGWFPVSAAALLAGVGIAALVVPRSDADSATGPPVTPDTPVDTTESSPEAAETTSASTGPSEPA